MKFIEVILNISDDCQEIHYINPSFPDHVAFWQQQAEHYAKQVKPVKSPKNALKSNPPKKAKSPRSAWSDWAAKNGV